MNETITTAADVRLSCEPSRAARERMRSRRGEPLFVAGWHQILMIHFEVDAQALQREVPFQLDLFGGRAFVSTVAFTMRGMMPRRGGNVAAWCFRPIATHDFLNVRTYVRQGGETGIHFLAEWLSSRLAAKLGPVTFGLPYRYGRIAYDHDGRNEVVQGQVLDDDGGKFAYRATGHHREPMRACAAGSHDEWLMERYTAFNSAGWQKRFFRVWHPPWPQCAVSATVHDLTLLIRRWPWFKDAQIVGANYSPGFDEVWMGRPHRVRETRS
jgi:uncharacterized protein YqjF (DUF2071 family)